MNVERLNKLAGCVRKGYHQFGSWNVVFGMDSIFRPLMTQLEKRYHIPKSLDLPSDIDFNSRADLIGFTLLLFDNSSLLAKYIRKEDEIRSTNLEIEAGRLLGLGLTQSSVLFYGCLSSIITGEEAYRTIHKMTITGIVDWNKVQV